MQPLRDAGITATVITFLHSLRQRRQQSPQDDGDDAEESDGTDEGGAFHSVNNEDGG
ncbi:MAG: hypothetical protein Greene041619_201 [Candidatus Peregrinibacteria bacterium Greene0416_19]|nr:MAG: hypothetical protein Greene041619_201 [Candidatus Peregrinibacteria bacterium Greene0416_19]